MPDERTSYPYLANAKEKAKDRHSVGLYYNDNYAIENFINTYASSESDVFNALSDPTYVGFKLYFHFDAVSGLLADERNTNSALAYLDRIGQTERYNLLRRFINVLSRVNSETPWIFQTIEGLDDLYSIPFNEVYVNKQLVLGTLETIDGKISSLAQMYRQIAYDFERHVEVLPANLRRFSMSIYLYDFRNFSNLSQTAVDALQTIKNQNIKELNHILFDVGYCEFDISSGSQFISQASNAEVTPATNNLKINFQKHAVSGLFKTITGNTELKAEQFSILESGVTSTTDYRPATGLRKLKDDIKNDINALLDVDAWKTKLSNLYDDFSQRAIQEQRARLMRLYLGNVHGFGLDDILRYGADEDYRVAFNNIYSTQTGSKSLKFGNTQTTIDNLGNVYNT